MAKSSEEISKYNTSGGKTDSNISNDTLHVGGIPAEDFATHKYVQDYHDAKETIQKQYIDKQDAQKLAEAKAYTDVVVENQDFSSFAKVTDIQAVNRNLTEKINRDVSEVKSETNTKITAVVRDVNEFNDETTQEINTIKGNINNINSTTANLQQQVNTEKTARENADTALQNRIGSAEGEISTLETKTQELFTSVSNGKRNVAAAITDKGVVTASDATFETMANNIGLIEGGTDTSDATATEADILYGKTAYSQGFKRYGTHIDLDTSDATATDSDIALGKSAYVNGSKIYGSHYETGVDTADATATPYDIVEGKTAYINGEKVTGILNLSGAVPTYSSNDGVQKIYGGGTGNYTKGKIATRGDNGDNWRYPLYNSTTLEIIAQVNVYKNSNSATILYIDYIHGSTIANRSEIDISSVLDEVKNRLSSYDDYTASDIANLYLQVEGITIVNTPKPFIVISSSGSFKEHVLVLLPLIEVSTPSNDATIITWEVDFNNISYNILTNSSAFTMNFKEMEEHGKRLVGFCGFIDIDIDNLTIIRSDFSLSNYVYFNSTEIIPTFSASDRIIVYSGHRFTNDLYCVFLNESYIPIKVIKLNESAAIVTSDFKYLVTRTGEIFELSVNWNDYTVNKTLITNGTKISDDSVFMAFLGNKYIFTNYDGNEQIFYFDPTNSEPIQFLDNTSNNMGNSRSGNNPMHLGDTLLYYVNSSYSTLVEKFRYLQIKPSYEKLIALKYNGEYFYKQDSGILTAGQPDVRNGKSFIGYQGYPEVGTGDF